MKQHRKRTSAWTAGICCAALCMSQFSALTADAAGGSRVIRYGGAASSNRSAYDYGYYWTEPMYSYLTENPDGTFARVEYRSEANQVLVETFNTAGELLGTEKLAAELPMFGGFYSGQDANYLVFGDDNPNEDNTVPVLSVVKYSKTWQKLGKATMNGMNTFQMFYCGSLRMTEADGELYIHTCHTMYETKGYHHQANCTLVLDEASMTFSQQLIEVSNAMHGYFSHSFNQFVAVDGDDLYRADHGDAYERGVMISKAPRDDIRTCEYRTALAVGSTYEESGNDTGFTLGGFAVSNTSLIAAVSTVPQVSAGWSSDNQWNIELVVVEDKSQFESSDISEVKLTNYSNADGIGIGTPQLVALSDALYVVLWEETSANGTQTKAAMVNGRGVPVQDTVTLNVRLSDCQPIVTADGCIAWYVTDGGAPVVYLLDPDSVAEGMRGDVNADFAVDSADAQLTLNAYTAGMGGFANGLSKQQAASADVDADGTISVVDAQFILTYYVQNTLAGVPTTWQALFSAV